MAQSDEDFESYGLDDRCIVPWNDGSMYSGKVQKISDPVKEALIEGTPTRKNGKPQISENETPFKKSRQDRTKRIPGKVIDACTETGEKWFFLHYFGWGSSFDEWLPLSRMLPYSPKYISEMKVVNAEIKERERARREEEQREAKAKKSRKRSDPGDDADHSSHHTSRQRSPSSIGSATHSSQSRRADSGSRTGSISRGASIASRPHKRSRVVIDDGPGFEIKLSLPIDFKRMLVTDWRLVTRDRSIVESPRPISVVEIMKDFVEFKSRGADSGDSENSDLFMKSMITYFDYSLGMMSLYRFERNHYYAQRKGDSHFRASSVYGAEHLARLIVSMPTSLSQMASMDDITMEYIVKQLEASALFMTEHKNRYFAGESSYAAATRAYEIASIPNASAEIIQPVPESERADDD